MLSLKEHTQLPTKPVDENISIVQRPSPASKSMGPIRATAWFSRIEVIQTIDNFTTGMN